MDTRTRKIFLIFLWSLSSLPSFGQTELVPNPDFALSPDEEKFQKLLSQALGKKPWMLMTSESFKEQSFKAYQVSQSTQFWQVKGWHVPPGPMESYYFFSPDSAGLAYLRLENNVPSLVEEEKYAETAFKEALEAGRQYEVKIRFRWHIPEAKIPETFQPSTFLLALEKSPQSAKYRLLGRWKPNVAAIRRDKHRIKVIQSFQQNHGGYYPPDFAQDPDYITWYEETILFRAKGGEEKLRLQFGPKPKEGSPLEVFVSSVSLKALPRPSSLPGAGQADPGKE